MMWNRILAVATACALAWVLTSSGRDSHAEPPDGGTTLTLLHSNDTHSHIETFTDTIPQGGVARRKTLIERVRGEVGADHTLLLDAGDFFQGTIFFNAWGGSESIMAMNDMRYDAATLGNHEFDLGAAGLARALTGGPVKIAGDGYATEAPAFPIVATNLDVSGEAELQGLLHKYRVIEKAGNRYGVLGVVTEDLAKISSPGANIKVTWTA
jgi:2',3'-cyclic-nucleotide 2'-phosphodiesterase (5'-nucleotidase family)